MQYFIKRGDKVQGPFSREQLLAFQQNKKILESDLVSQSQEGPYQTLAQALEVPLASPYPQPMPQHLQSSPEAIPVTPPQSEIKTQPIMSAPTMSFGERTRNFVQDVKQEIVKSEVVPDIIQEIVGKDEAFLYAGRPSKMWFFLNLGRIIVVYLVLLLAINVVLSGAAAMGNALGNRGGGNFFFFLVINFLLVLPFALGCVALYLSWISTFFGITQTSIVVRRGFLNRYIAIAPVKSIQIVNINSGIFDRWLGMNSVLFQTAASSGITPIQMIFSVFSSSGLHFTNVYLEQVMPAYDKARLNN